jgi:hypothetical protein
VESRAGVVRVVPGHEEELAPLELFGRLLGAARQQSRRSISPGLAAIDAPVAASAPMLAPTIETVLAP